MNKGKGLDKDIFYTFSFKSGSHKSFDIISIKHKEKVKTSATWKTIQGARKCGRNATK